MPIVTSIRQHKILLDTHVWYWVALGEPMFRRDFLNSLESAKENDRIYLSAISVWEIGMMGTKKKKIQFEMDVLNWVEQSIGNLGIQLVPLSPKIAIESSRLPIEVHGDPADRILIASANEVNALLVTCDAQLIEYGKGKHISVYDPTKA
ncbi:MAG: type II toxin-antitoxin system VapC family toxin [Parachlamydia sp.]|nr:type II toxin-antitoxin system VapC family toxin [Parachlamydia sp.]